jgi:hypothetical protein
MKKFKTTFRKSPIPYRFRTEKEIPSDLRAFKEHWHKKGFELVNVTELLEVKMGTSGWHGDLQDYEETIHHIQLWYQGENVGSIGPGKENIVDSKYVLFTCNQDDILGADFIIFRKIPIVKEEVYDKSEKPVKTPWYDVVLGRIRDAKEKKDE